MVNKKRVFITVGLLVSILVMAALVVSWILRERLTIFLSTEIKLYGYLITFFVSAILEFLPQWISPHFLMLNTAVIGLPSLTSLILIILGSTFGAVIGFETGRKYGFNLACRLYGEKKVQKVKKILNSHGRWIITVSAFTPIPYIPLIFSSLGMERKEFLLYGLLPRILSFIVLWVFILYNIDIPLL